MALKKSELYSSLWASCDELRGGMDASQYKDYVLVLLFMKYVSDKAASQRGYLLDVPTGGSFADMVALKGDKEIGDKINKIIARLAEANDLKGVIDVADFNDADKLGKGKENDYRPTTRLLGAQGRAARVGQGSQAPRHPAERHGAAGAGGVAEHTPRLRGRAPVPEQSRHAADHQGDPGPGGQVRPNGGPGGAQPPRPAALVRQASRGGGGGPARSIG